MLDAKPRSRDTAFDPRPARTRGGGHPTLSIVCIASDDSTTFRELADRPARWQALGVELIIVCVTRHSAASTASATSAGARLIFGPADATCQQLRSMGLAAASGDVVMLLDDPASADEGWIERLCTTGETAS
jgi:hypothetical protein